jgi:hypothetical protein
MMIKNNDHILPNFRQKSRNWQKCDLLLIIGKSQNMHKIPYLYPWLVDFGHFGVFG